MGLTSSAITSSVRERHGNDKLTADEVVTARAAVLAAVRDGGRTRESAKAAGVSWALILKWSKSDAAFAEEIAEARREGSPARTAAERAVRERAKRERAKTPAPLTVPSVPKSGPPYAPWGRSEDALLRHLAGRATTAEIARRWDAEGFPKRSAGAFRCRARVLDLSLWPSEFLSLSELRRVFRCGYAVIEAVVEGGWLRLEPGAWRARLVARSEVERFIRAHPWAYSPAQLGRGPLADLARTVHRSDPWITLDETVRYLGMREWEVLRLAADGVLVARRRLFGRNHPIVYRRRDVVAYARDQLKRGA